MSLLDQLLRKQRSSGARRFDLPVAAPLPERNCRLLNGDIGGSGTGSRRDWKCTATDTFARRNLLNMSMSADLKTSDANNGNTREPTTIDDQLFNGGHLDGDLFPGVCVDRFDADSRRLSSLFFLTHTHSCDDSIGISDAFFDDLKRLKYKLYCSRATFTWLRESYSNIADKIEATVTIVEPGKQYSLAAVDRTIAASGDRSVTRTPITVSVIDSNHCHGAVMFLFERDIVGGSNGNSGDEKITPKTKRILYTGAMRFDDAWFEKLNTSGSVEKRFLQHPDGNMKQLDAVYVNGGLCHPKCTALPARTRSVQEIVDLVKENRENFSIMLSLDERYSGGEDIIREIHRQTGEKVQVEDNFFDTLATDPQMDGCYIDPFNHDQKSRVYANFHEYDGLEAEYVLERKDMLEERRTKVLVVRPRSMWFINNGFAPDGDTLTAPIDLDDILPYGETIIPEQCGKHKGVRVWYAEHSSAVELRAFIRRIQPKRVRLTALPKDITVAMVRQLLLDVDCDQMAIQLQQQQGQLIDKQGISSFQTVEKGRLLESDFIGIAVDNFRDDVRCSSAAFFLTHMHSDHTDGLNESGAFARFLQKFNFKLFCSENTRHCLIQKHPELVDCVVAMDMAKPYCIDIRPSSDMVNAGFGFGPYQVLVTAIPANHCFGSVMFLFERLPKKEMAKIGGPSGKGWRKVSYDGGENGGETKRVLHCGDTRLEKPFFDQLKNLNVKEFSPLYDSDGALKQLQAVYLDATFCHQNAAHLPNKDKSCSAVVFAVKKFIAENGHNAVVVLSLGAKYTAEDVLTAVGNETGLKIHMETELFGAYSHDEGLKPLLTDVLWADVYARRFAGNIDNDECDYVLECRKSKLADSLDTSDFKSYLPSRATEKLAKYLNHMGERAKVLVIRLSAQWFLKNGGESADGVSAEYERVQGPRKAGLRILYATHSSTDELREFLAYLKPENVRLTALHPETSVEEAKQLLKWSGYK